MVNSREHTNISICSCSASKMIVLISFGKHAVLSFPNSELAGVFASERRRFIQPAPFNSLQTRQQLLSITQKRPSRAVSTGLSIVSPRKYDWLNCCIYCVFILHVHFRRLHTGTVTNCGRGEATTAFGFDGDCN